MSGPNNQDLNWDPTSQTAKQTDAALDYWPNAQTIVYAVPATYGSWETRTKSEELKDIAVCIAKDSDSAIANCDPHTLTQTGIDDVTFGTVGRHTDTTPEQWRDPTRTTRIWPDPPIKMRAWDFLAYLGIHAGESWVDGDDSIYNWGEDGAGINDDGWGQVSYSSVTSDSDIAGQYSATPLSMKINGVVVTTTPVAMEDGMIVGSNYTDTRGGGPNKGSFDDGIWRPRYYSRFGTDYARLAGDAGVKNAAIYARRYFHEFPGATTTVRRIYEPHFISTPDETGLNFVREGVETMNLQYYYGQRIVYKNPRAESRDFGVSQTMKIPTGGIGGNPFWLKDTKDWPDILRSLHFDFAPFMVPGTKVTRPITYRFWDTLYSTAIFGGPTFSIILDEYGMFDEEYYRMVVRNFTQSEQQIVQWRQGLWGAYPDVANDPSAMFPRNYVNPHAWYQQRMRTDAFVSSDRRAFFNGHPFKDTQAANFIGNTGLDKRIDENAANPYLGDNYFSMAGWSGPCAELVLGQEPDTKVVDANGVTQRVPKLAGGPGPGSVEMNPDPVLKKAYPYYDSLEELTMNNKRKLHQEALYQTNQNAVQDFYYTFVLAADAAAAYGRNLDLFAYSKSLNELEQVTPEMLSHRVPGSKAHDIPFTIGNRLKKMLQTDASYVNEFRASVGECFDDTVSNDIMVANLHGPITEFVQRCVTDKLQEIQKWAWEKLVTIAKEQASKIFEKWVWPNIQPTLKPLLDSAKKMFPKLYDFIKSQLASLKKGVLGVDFFQSPATYVDDIMKKVKSWVDNLGEDAVNAIGDAASEKLQQIVQSIKNRFVGKPSIKSLPGQPGEDEDLDPLDREGFGEGDIQMTEFSRTPANQVKDLETLMEEGDEATEVAAADGATAVEAAAEATMSSVCGPLILAVAVTVVLDWWEKKQEAEAKAAQAAAQAALTWKTWDTLRVPLNRDYLAKFNTGAHLNALFHSKMTPKGITDPIDLYNANVNLNDRDPGARNNFLQFIDNEEKSTDRYINFDTTSGGTLEADIRTLANLIGMNHLCIKVVDPYWFEENDTDATPATTLRAQQLLKTAEIIRTLRVTDHFMRGHTWADDATTWKPFPPMEGIPASLDAKRMTPIPVLVPQKAYVYGPTWQQMSSSVKGTALFTLVESGGSDVWNTYVQTIVNDYGVCPMYEHQEHDYETVITLKEGGTSPVKGTDVTRQIPVPIFAPGRSPTMFVSSLDPTFAWPTLGMNGVKMSAFLDETAYFTTHNICFTPFSGTNDGDALSEWLPKATTGTGGCIPTFGMKGYKFLLMPTIDASRDIPDTIIFTNSSTYTVTLVQLDELQVVGRTLAPNDIESLPKSNGTYILSEAGVVEWNKPEDNAPFEDWKDDFLRALPPKYRSVAFKLDGFNGHIEVFDYTRTSADIYHFEQRMLNLVVPIMNGNPHCYEPLAAFWSTEYTKLQTKPFRFHEEVCKWLLTVIPEPTKDATGTPVAQPTDIGKQLNIYLLAHNVFSGNEDSWQTTFNSTPAESEYNTGSTTFNHTPCEDGPVGPAKTPKETHPKTTPEGGVRMHYNVDYTQDATMNAQAASYGYEPEQTNIRTKLAAIIPALQILADSRYGSDDPAPDPFVQGLVGDIINNNQDLYDALKEVKDNGNYNEADIYADAMACLKLAEDIRIQRISAILKFSSDIDTTRAERAVDDYETRTNDRSTIARALKMLFTVRKNPRLQFTGKESFTTYPPMHQLLAQMAKDCYIKDGPRSSLLHPTTHEIAIYLPAATGSTPQGPLSTSTIVTEDTETLSPQSDYDGSQWRGWKVPDNVMALCAQDLANRNIKGTVTKAYITMDDKNLPHVAYDYTFYPPPLASTEEYSIYYMPKLTDGTATTIVSTIPAVPDDSGQGWGVPPNVRVLVAEDMASKGLTGTVSDSFDIDFSGADPVVTYTVTGISGPTLIVAFRGTDPEKDIEAKFGKKTGIPLYQKVAVFLNPYSDLMSDLNIALGNQAESGRFTDSDALIKNVIALYNVANVIVTGHSLGGSLAMHCLELNPKIVTQGVVFNPGKGLDGGYFDQVDAEISTPITTKWYNYLTTYRVGGSSSWPLDDDPVSVLSGGVGDCRLIQGPGVPAKLKAHSSSNWDTTGVLRALHTQIVYPTRR
jgi:hypothetical protein